MIRQPKSYTEILWDSEREKKEFFEKLIPLLSETKKNGATRLSARFHAERFAQAVVHEFWRVAWKEMIHNNRNITLYRSQSRLSIAKLPPRHYEKLGLWNMKHPVFVPFFSRKEGTRFGIVYFKLRRGFKKELNQEINKGHEYRYGKPTF